MDRREYLELGAVIGATAILALLMRGCGNAPPPAETHQVGTSEAPPVKVEPVRTPTPVAAVEPPPKPFPPGPRVTYQQSQKRTTPDTTVCRKSSGRPQEQDHVHMGGMVLPVYRKPSQ